MIVFREIGDMHGRLWAMVLVAGLALVVPGCMGDVTAGGMKEVEMYAVADGGSEGIRSAAASDPVLLPMRVDGEGGPRSMTTLAVEGLQGTIEFDVTATLIDDQGVNIRLATDTRVPLRLEARDSTRFAQRRVPSAEYPILRLTFTRVVATVELGLGVGVRPGPVRVEIPAGGAIVDVPVDLNVPARPLETIVVDLNASAWMPTLDVLTGVVPASAFRSAVRVRVR
jgi:hypothetical protein